MKRLISANAVCVLRHAISLALAGGVVALTLGQVPVRPSSVAASLTAGTATQTAKLKKHDRLRLAEARAQARPEVTLLIASAPGANEKVVQEVTRAGGRVQYRDDDISYLRVKVPTGSVEKIAQASGVEAVNIDGAIIYVSQPPIQTSQTTSPNRIAPPDASTPAENPYLPSRDVGAPQFISAHPTFDGRGVTVAVIDTNVDLLTPELQTAKTLDGTSVRKIRDVTNAALKALDASEDRGRLSSYIQVDMNAEVRPASAMVVHKDRQYTLPAAGRYRIGLLDERMNGNARGDLNLDENPPASEGLFGVLWDEKTNTVWVDTNQNRNFADETAMTDFSIKGDIGLFGQKDARDLKRKTVGFTIQTDPAHRTVFITPGLGLHGTAVTGSAFGKGFFGGELNGVAPEAQLVLVPFVGITHSLIESLIVAVKHPQVDIVSIQTVYHMDLNDGDSTLSNIADRLVEKYKKPIFAGAGNAGDEVNIIHEGAAARRVITVGSYISRETSAVNYGIPTTRRDNIDVASSRGPSETGVFKPDILAPTMALTTIPRFLSPQTYNNTYDPPVGYGVVGGTSTATPMAAASAALLLSAAKQNGVAYDAARLRWAITSTARYLQEYGAYEQGAGLLQINEAWEALKRAPAPVEITSRAPIKTVLGKYLKEPNQGVGLYEREGWTVGQSGKRSITFTRTSGSKSPITYSLRWIGNDGTFSCAKTVSLSLNQPVELTMTIAPATPGVHSAILNLDGPGGAEAVHQVMTTVVAAQEFSAQRNFTITHSGIAEWMDSRSYYVFIPPQTPALDLNFQISSGNARLGLMRPSGEPYYKLATYSVDPCKFQTGGSCGLVVRDPEAGVWQIIVENTSTRGESRFASPNRANFTINAALVGPRMNVETIDLDPGLAVLNRGKSFEFTNHFGSFSGGVVASSLGSSFSDRPTLKETSEPRVYEVNVTDGTQSLVASIANVSQAGADLDLYLFDCTTGQCVLKDISQREGSEERVEFEQPAAGKWKILVDPYSLPAGSASFDYFDLLTNPVFGEIVPLEAPAVREARARWVEPVRIRVDAVPIGPRSLAGFVTVKVNDVVLRKTLIKVGNAAALISNR